MVERGGKQGAGHPPVMGQVSVSPQGFPSGKNLSFGVSTRLGPAVHRSRYFLRRADCVSRDSGRATEILRAAMPAGPWWRAEKRGHGAARISFVCRAFHDRIRNRPAAPAAARADRARGPAVPRHHLGGLGLQLAGDEIPAERTAAADLARGDRRDRRAAAGRLCADPPRRACRSARGSGRGSSWRRSSTSPAGWC